MRTHGFRQLSLAALLGAIVGCAASGPNLRTPIPESYALPPADDPRFSQPLSYPKETLNTEQISKPSNAAPPKLPSTQPMNPAGGRVGGAPGF